MKYGWGRCAECRRRVMTDLLGRAVAHSAPGSELMCDGAGEVADGVPAPAAVIAAKPPEPPPVTPAAAPPPLPLAVKRTRAPRRTSRAVGAEIKEAENRVASADDLGGSIDLEALSNCDCPSLAAAIRRYLGR